MKLTILCVGKLKEAYWRLAVEEYQKRLGRYLTLEIRELPDEKAPENLSAAQALQVLEKEGQRIQKAIPEGAFVVALAINGRTFSSEAFSTWLADHALHATDHIVFLIGGSLGLSASVLSQASLSLSFSPMTFPHQLMRVILLEQLYRAVKIDRNEPYHK